MRSRHLPAAAALLASAALAACDIVPTSRPQWEMRWNVPTRSTTIAVNTLLPTGVGIAGNAFSVTVGTPPTITVQLATVCPQCATAPAGVPIPKPAFSFTERSSASFPADVSSAQLASGSIDVTVTNRLNFDPLRVAQSGGQPTPGATQGTLLLIARDASSPARELGRTQVTGATTTLAPNATQTFNLALAPGTVRGPITIEAQLTSPTGDPVTQPSGSILVGGAPRNVTVSNASVGVTGRTISSAATTIDLGGFDESLAKRVVRGDMLLTITNPFNVSGNLEVSLAGGTGGTIRKQLALAGGNISRTISFTGAELQSLLGNNISLSIAGPVSATGPITVNPSDVVNIVTRLDLIISTEAQR